MSNIYIVQGSRGEYSDHVEWLVAAYKSELSAANLVIKLTAATEAVETLQEDWIADYAKYFEESTAIMVEAGDPHWSTSSYGTLYTYFPVELRD